jgi:hypothetical protein
MAGDRDHADLGLATNATLLLQLSLGLELVDETTWTIRVNQAVSTHYITHKYAKQYKIASVKLTSI